MAASHLAHQLCTSLRQCERAAVHVLQGSVEPCTPRSAALLHDVCTHTPLGRAPHGAVLQWSCVAAYPAYTLQLSAEQSAALAAAGHHRTAFSSPKSSSSCRVSRVPTNCARKRGSARRQTTQYREHTCLTHTLPLAWT